MKRFLGQWLLSGTVALAAIAAPRALAAPVAAPPGDTLYLAVGTDDPLAFDRLRYGRDSGQVNEDLIIPTLRARAAAMARAAGLEVPIVTLDEDARPPAGEPVLRLTWGLGGKVFAEYLATAGARPVFLGVVSRDSLAYHPTPAAALNRVLSAPSGEARRDESVRANTEMQLYLALGLVRQHLAGR
jgi:hypothetical protein